MKQLLLTTKFPRMLGVFSAALFLTASALAQPIPEMLYYQFNGTGTTVPNMASSPPAGTATATIMGGVTQGSTGLCGGALVGTGVSASTDYLNTGFVTAMPTSWTISFWAQGISTNTTLYYIFGDNTAGSFRCFTNGVAGSTNWILRGTGITDVLINGGATPTPHVCTYVYDGTVNTIYAYLDGVLVNTVVQGGPIVLNGTGPFKVMGYGTNVGAPAGGLMDEFRMYNRALTAAEVLELNNGVATTTETVTTCDSYLWPADGNTYTSSGTYMTNISNPTGCDTNVVLNLTILTASPAPVETVVACDSYTWGGMDYFASGVYYDTLVASNGCDSLLTLDLTINTSPSYQETVTACDSYTWAVDGNTYSNSGAYSYVVAGSPCDTTYNLDLTINQSTSSTITEVAIDTYTSPGGTTYTNSGTYIDVIPNAAGCDSTITINLTIEHSGINELNGVSYVVYPNPADDQIQIEGLEAIADLKGVYITSVSGARVMEVKNPFKPIGIGALEAGTYILQIESATGTSTVRFVKK